MASEVVGWPNIPDAHTVYKRYKDLVLVESAFRTCKSSLELRSVYVRREKSTYGHIFVSQVHNLV